MRRHGVVLLYRQWQQLGLLVFVIFLRPHTAFPKNIMPKFLYVVDRVLFSNYLTFRRCAVWDTLTFAEWIIW